jgi:caa(3)-type oxidase subunit IV
MKSGPDSILRLWLEPGLVWLLLAALLAATVFAAYIPLGALNGVISMAIAATKSVLILIFFMKLKTSSAPVRLASLAGLFWLVLMFCLTAGDYLTRQ